MLEHSINIYAGAQYQHIYWSTVLTYMLEHSINIYAGAQYQHIYWSTVLTYMLEHSLNIYAVAHRVAANVPLARRLTGTNDSDGNE
jgi:ribosomal protein S19